MILPENGKIVVIDDKYQEVKTLISIFTKKGLPVIYLDGNRGELPKRPLDNVRLVFLDIELNTGSVSDKMKVSKVVSIFKKIIGKQSSPYLVLAWTKNEYLLDLLKEGLNKGVHFREPILCLNMEKVQCMDGNGDFSFESISNKLKEGIKESGIFELFILWENFVSRSAGQTVNDFSSFYGYGKEWNRNLSGIIYSLAKAYAGRQLDTDSRDEILKNSLLTFNGSFVDILEKMIRDSDYGEIENVEFSDPGITSEIKAKINSMLFIIKDVHKLQPGNVYQVKKNTGDGFQKSVFSDCLDREGAFDRYAAESEVEKNEMLDDNRKLKRRRKKEFDKFCKDLRQEIRERSKFVRMEVSPSCDYAQDKWKAHRFLPGILWPSEYSDLLMKRTDYLYISPLLHLDDAFYRIVFDFRYQTSIPVIKFNTKKAYFRFRHQLLVDIQSRLASHVSRPGLVNL